MVMAQTNVTISGRLAAGYDNYKLSGGGVGGHDTYNGLSDQSSRIIFNVVEDLGGGLKAWGQVDSRLSLTEGKGGEGAGNGWATGNSGLGLMSDSWGKFTLGNWDVHYNEMAVATNALNRAGSLESISSFGVLSQVNGVTVGKGTRTNNLLMWDSPNWNGFTARLGYSTNPMGAEGVDNRAAGDPGKGSMWTGALRYSNGPWKAGFSYWNHQIEGSSLYPGAAALPAGTPAPVVAAAMAAQQSRVTGYRIGGSYAFSMGLSIGLAYDNSRVRFEQNGVSSWKRAAWYVPINYAWGPHKIYFDYSHAGDTKGLNGNQKATQWGLGYDYAFSKRTSMGIFYTKVDNKDGNYSMFSARNRNSTAPTARPGTAGSLMAGGGEDSRQIYIGIAHNF